MQLTTQNGRGTSAPSLPGLPQSPSKLHDKKIVEIAKNKGSACRVLIVDRDSMTSDLLVNALMKDRRFKAAAIHPIELLHTVSTSEFHLAIIGANANSLSGSGYDLVQSVCRMNPETCVVMLLDHPTNEAVVSALRAGARGVFTRQQPMNEFLDCVEHVRKGFIWAGNKETKHILEAFRTMPRPTVVNEADSSELTARELEVVQHAAQGKTNKAIARELGLSTHTVKNYLFRSFAKLGVSNRVELLFQLTIRGFAPDELGRRPISKSAGNLF
jgi:DNA-binding NarL/FixJ family response regulator